MTNVNVSLAALRKNAPRPPPQEAQHAEPQVQPRVSKGRRPRNRAWDEIDFQAAAKKKGRRPRSRAWDEIDFQAAAKKQIVYTDEVLLESLLNIAFGVFPAA